MTLAVVLLVLASSLAWFFVAALLFFNPFVGPLYRSEEGHPAVRSLQQSPAAGVRILVAILVQVIAWAWVYRLVEPALPTSALGSGLAFGVLIVLMKLLPRDIDRLLLTTYPIRRMAIEFVIGVVCAFVVGFVFSLGLRQA
jgi:putative flippase GtrA